MTAPGPGVEEVLGLFDIACRLGLDWYSHSFLNILEQLSRVQTQKDRCQVLYKWLLDSTAQVLQAQEFLELHSVPGAWRCLSVRSLPLRSLATLVGSDGLCVNEAPCETRCAQLLTGEALECDPLLGGGPGVRTPCHHQSGVFFSDQH